MDPLLLKWVDGFQVTRYIPKNKLHSCFVDNLKNLGIVFNFLDAVALVTVFFRYSDNYS
jgi:hypothetical protein